MRTMRRRRIEGGSSETSDAQVLSTPSAGELAPHSPASAPRRKRRGPKQGKREAGVPKRPSGSGAHLQSGGVVNAFWQKKDLTLVVHDSSTPNGIRYRRIKAEHSCFVRREDLQDDVQFVRMLNHHHAVRKAVWEGDWLRIAWQDRDALKHYCKLLQADQDENGVERPAIPTFEGMVSPVLRHMVDNDLWPAHPRQVWVDLETDSRVPFSRKEEMRILCWATEDADGNKRSEVLTEDTDAAERELLLQLWEVLDRYDQIMAWNGDRFDFPVIKARSELHDLLRPQTREWRRWMWLDQLDLHRRMNMAAAESGDEKQSMALGAVATALLGTGKDDFDASKTWEAWEAGGSERDRMHAYCVKDTALLPMIEAKTGFIMLLQTVADTCGTFADTRGSKPGVQVEGFLARLALQRGHKFPTVLRPKLGDKYEGAYVLHPEKNAGIHRGVHVADFASLYPTIIRTWNMSPETIVEEPDGLPVAHSPLTMKDFRTDIDGILPEAVKQLMQLRKEWNDKKTSLPPGTDEWKDADRRSAAYKITANSFYGVIGDPTSRHYDVRVAESVTQCGKWLILETMKAAELQGMKVIYGDTDSLFVADATKEEFNDFVRACNVDLYPDSLASLGCADNCIKLAYEKQFDRLVFTTAKRYCNPPEAPVWMADGSFKPLGEVAEGNIVMGWDRPGGGKKRKLVSSVVVATHRHEADLVTVDFKSGRQIQCTPDHRWSAYPSRMPGNSEFVEAKVGRKLCSVVNDVCCPTRWKADARWLGRIFDGEGPVAGAPRNQITISQSEIVNPEVCAEIRRVLGGLGFAWSEHDDGSCIRFVLKGSSTMSPLQTRLNFIKWCRPVKGAKIRETFAVHRFGVGDEVIGVHPARRREVIGLTTTTGNYVAWGFASRNCGNYVHYKGTEADATSKPEIKGLEFKRGDSLRLTRRFQEEIAYMLVGYKSTADPDDPTEFDAVCKLWLDRVMEAPFDLDDIVVSKRLNKPLDAYKANPPMVRIAREMEAKGEDVEEGAKVRYVVTDAAQSPQVVLNADEWTQDTHIDRMALWDKLVWPPTERLLHAAFPAHNWKPFAGFVRARKALERQRAKDAKAAEKAAEKAARAEQRAKKAAQPPPRRKRRPSPT